MPVKLNTVAENSFQNSKFNLPRLNVDVFFHLVLIVFVCVSVWAVLGKPQPEHSLSSVTYTEAGFQGHITKAQIWLRALDVSSELQKQVRDCRSEPILYRDLILNWAGYEITSGGVERNVPSTCGQKKCSSSNGGSQCNQVDVDKEPPQVQHCPGDLWIISRNGSAQVSNKSKKVTEKNVMQIQFC